MVAGSWLWSREIPRKARGPVAPRAELHNPAAAPSRQAAIDVARRPGGHFQWIVCLAVLNVCDSHEALLFLRGANLDCAKLGRSGEKFARVLVTWIADDIFDPPLLTMTIWLPIVMP